MSLNLNLLACAIACCALLVLWRASARRRVELTATWRVIGRRAWHHLKEFLLTCLAAAVFFVFWLFDDDDE